jgi:D-glycero-D-manno-heptose 1,7-bisphosphate phosphatase
MKRLLILDRDGVINFDSPEYIKHPDEWQAIPGSLAAIAKACQHGAVVTVVSNQSGLGRGLFTEKTLGQIHAKLRHSVAKAGGRISDLRYCPHHPEVACDCRKPHTQLIEDLLAAHREAWEKRADVWLIGDKISDIQAARRAQLQAVLVLTGYGQKTYAEQRENLSDVMICADLAEAINLFCLNLN